VPKNLDRESEQVDLKANDDSESPLKQGIRDRMGTAMLAPTLMDRVQGPLAGSIGLRPALAADEAFLYRVFTSTREELRLVDWDDDPKAALLTMQFSAQRSAYRQGFPGSGYDVILIGDQPVGRLFVHRDADAIRIVDLGLLPEYRNRGIGGAILKAVLNEAAEAGKPVRLHVESFNRALKLYERLGLRPVRIDGIHVEMEWDPCIAPD
jgi:GNAT superfamily N-acetyltransferase